jgi:hypothetical protein
VLLAAKRNEGELPVMKWCVERVARAVVFGMVGLMLGSRA